MGLGQLNRILINFCNCEHNDNPISEEVINGLISLFTKKHLHQIRLEGFGDNKLSRQLIDVLKRVLLRRDKTSELTIILFSYSRTIGSSDLFDLVATACAKGIERFAIASRTN